MLKDELIQQIKYLKKFKGITYTWIGKQVGLTGTQVSHFIGGGYLSKQKTNNLNEFIKGFLYEINSINRKLN